ncbi:hypothetical protein ScPMuIL_016663 [Solemya velum]
MGTQSTRRAFCCVKYVFFTFNVLVWLLGCGVLSVGIWMRINRGEYMDLLPSVGFLSATTLCIVSGAVILVVGFCGFCGALMENKCLLIMYFIIVLIIFGLEVAATVLGLTNKDEIKGQISEELSYSMQQKYYQPITEDSKDSEVVVIDLIQKELECCGVNNHTDWHNVEAWSGKPSLPDSCCVEKKCAIWYDKGCLEEIEYWFVKNMYILGVLALTIAVVQILAMMAAVMLFCCLRKDKFYL